MWTDSENAGHARRKPRRFHLTITSFVPGRVQRAQTRATLPSPPYLSLPLSLFLYLSLFRCPFRSPLSLSLSLTLFPPLSLSLSAETNASVRTYSFLCAAQRANWMQCAVSRARANYMATLDRWPGNLPGAAWPPSVDRASPCPGPNFPLLCPSATVGQY